MTTLQLKVIAFQFAILWFVTIWQRHRKHGRKYWEARGHRDVHSIRLSRLNSQKFQRLGWLTWVVLTQWLMLHGYAFLYGLFFGVFVWVIVYGIGRYWFHTHNPYGDVAIDEVQNGMVPNHRPVAPQAYKGSARQVHAGNDPDMLDGGTR